MVLQPLMIDYPSFMNDLEQFAQGDYYFWPKPARLVLKAGLADSPYPTGSISLCFGWRDLACPSVFWISNHLDVL